MQDGGFVRVRATPLEAVEIGFLDPTARGAGFDELRLRVELGGATLLDLVFDEVAAALAYLDDRVLLFDAPSPPTSGSRLETLRILFDLATDAPGAGFRTGLVVSAQVPGPALALLLTLALVVALGWGRRGRRSRPAG